MDNFVVEKYVIILDYENEKRKLEFSKYHLGEVKLKRIDGEKVLDFDLDDIKDEELNKFLKKYYANICTKRLQYANKSLYLYLRGKEIPSLEKHGVSEVVEEKVLNSCKVQVTRYYFDPITFFEKLFNVKWNSKDKKKQAKN